MKSQSKLSLRRRENPTRVHTASYRKIPKRGKVRFPLRELPTLGTLWYRKLSPLSFEYLAQKSLQILLTPSIFVIFFPSPHLLPLVTLLFQLIGDVSLYHSTHNAVYHLLCYLRNQFTFETVSNGF